MEANKDIIWKKLQQYSLDDPSSEYKFSDRLAKENKWSKKFSLRIIEEYKKFIFLSVFARHPVTPSKKLDEVWHLHLLYTRSYWEDMCDGILGRKIHHGPTKGGKKEDDRYSNLYAKTLDSYRRFFGDPPQDVWFDTKPEKKKLWAFPKIAACFTPILLSGFISIQNPWLIGALIIGLILLLVIALIWASTDTGKSKRAAEEKSLYRSLHSQRGSTPPSRPSSISSIKKDSTNKSSASGNSNSNSNGCTTFIPYSCSSPSSSKSSSSDASSCSSASCSSGSSCGSSCGGGGCGGGD